jgi:antitoxin component YwqK of YwqJK toxin-antitoxin module
VNDSIAYCKSWFPNGKLSSEGYLLNIESEGLSFVQDGLWKKYKYKSGRLLLEGKYLWGEKIGVWYEYDRKGKVCDEIDYKEGLTKNYW